MKWLSAALSSLFLAGTLGVAVSAQNFSSHLAGVVKDSQGAVLPGVTVTATSPALIGQQTVISEANGTYQFPSLPEGTYTVKFELAGFQTTTQSNIHLGINQTLTVDASMQVGTLAETVTVTALSPVVDVKTTAVGNVLDAQKLIAVPTSSDLWGALAQAPGVMMEGFDVGGSHKFQQDGYVTFGVQNQNRVITEGVDTTEGTGGSGFYQDYYSQNEINVSGAGQDVAMNTPGAAVISTIKSGGNQLRGLFVQEYEPSSFVGNNATGDAAIASRGGSANPNLLYWQSHADAGGPIVKDKAWFFGAFNHFHINKAESGIPTNLGTALGIFNDVTTKETYKPSQSDTLIGYYQWAKKDEPLRGLGITTPAQSALAEYSPSWMYNGKWQRVWSNRLFTEVNVGEFGYDFPEVPSVSPTIAPPIHDSITGLDSGAGWFNAAGAGGPFDLERAKPQIFATATYFLPSEHGSHDLKMGYEWRNDMETFARIGTSGQSLMFYNSGVPSQVELQDTGTYATLGSKWTVPIDGNHGQALFFQDRWTANSHLTLTAGLRYDRQQDYYTSAIHAPVLANVFPSYTTTAANDSPLFNNIAPRLGVTIDPQGDGKTAVKAFYGRYYFNIAQTFSGADPGGANWRTYQYNNVEGNGLYNGPQDLGALVSSAGGASTTFNPNMPNAYTDEMDLSVERQFWGESSLRVGYVRKMVRNQYGAYNQNWLNQFTNPYNTTLTLEQYNASNPKAPIVTGTMPITVYDVPNSLKGHVSNIINTLPGDAASSTYDTIEAYLNKRFSNGMFLTAGYDWTRSLQYTEPTQSTDPLTQSEPLNLPGAGGSAYAFNINPAVNFYQPITQWSIVLQSRYVFPYGIGLAPNFRYQSGWNYAPLGTVKLPNAGNQNIFLSNLTQRSDNVPFLNVRVDKSIPIPGNRQVLLALDCYNILNAAPVDLFNLNQTGATFNQIIGMLDPRTFEVTMRLQF